MTKPVALVDLEGVLFPEMWPFIAAAIGDRNLEITTREVSDYPSLMAQRLELLRTNDVRLSDVEDIVSGMSCLPGALNFIDALKSFAEVTIVTDSFSPMNTHALEALSVSRVFTNHFAADFQGFATECFYWHRGQGKARVYDFISQSATPTLAIGDGLNDLDMLHRADLGVLYNPSDITLKAAGDVTVLRDLKEVLKSFSECVTTHAPKRQTKTIR